MQGKKFLNMECIFCKIIKKEIPASIFYEDDKILAFHDINPQAPLHLLIIPKKHIATILEVTGEDEKLLGHILGIIPKLAKKAEIDKDGFRIIINCGESAGQVVFHLHLHLLGKRKFSWPPG